jgi:BASS family bile acid:Na+ symporter
MSVAAIVLLALKLSVAAQVFALGLKTTYADLAYLPNRPMQFVRSLASMNLVMPLFAAAIALLFALRTPVEIMLVCIALSPVPPLLPSKQAKSGGNAAYGVSLLCWAALVAIFSIPLLLELLEDAFNVPMRMSPWRVAQIMLTTVLLPLCLGMLARVLAPKLAARFATPVMAVAAAVLPVAALGIIIASWPAILAQLGDGTALTLALFALVALAVGHVLGGPDPADRTVLSLSTASRHPGMAAAIASANFPEQHAAMAVLLLYLVLGGIASGLYLFWRKRREAHALPHARMR